METANGEVMGPTLIININTNVEGRFVELNQNSSIQETILMEEAPIVRDLEASMQRQLDTLYHNANEAEAGNFTIFRIPHNISKNKKNFFEPSVISIGPFHRGQKHLRALEEQKWRSLQDFLSRGDHISLDLCISEMKLLEKRTRKCYSETFDDFSSNAFVEMMLLDGCFVLEHFLYHMGKNVSSIGEVGWSGSFIVFDLLLLENQIPFFIVEKLYEISNLNQELHKMVFVKCLAGIFLSIGLSKSLQSIISYRPAEFLDSNDYLCSIIPDTPAKIYHLSHLCYHYLVPNPEKPVVLSSKLFDLTKKFSAIRIIKLLLHRFRSRVLRGRSPHLTSQTLLVQFMNSTSNISSMVIPSATELKQKGLKFIPKRNPKHMLDISFEYGVLNIPRLTISDNTKPIFSNLIAFEQSKYGKKNKPLTSFIEFLDNIVNTPNDVTILQECRIIENLLGSEEELAHFVNQVNEDLEVDNNHYLVELYTEVNRYSESSWNKQRAKLIRDYFSSPWAAIYFSHCCFDTSSSYLCTIFLCSLFLHTPPELMML